MKTIHKFTIDLDFIAVSIEMPEDPKILTAQIQDGKIAIWAEVESTNPKTNYFFYVIPTGGRVPAGAEVYVTTLQHRGDVYHVYY